MKREKNSDTVTMESKENKTPALLINDYTAIDAHFNKTIVNAPYSPMDSETPACRFRGTLVDMRGDDGKITITGWQRNIARIRKMDVSLPTIITLTLTGNAVIEDIHLDDSFKGSKGLVCSWKYLNQNIRHTLMGQVLDAGFVQKIRVEKTHCFHMFEVLAGIYSYFHILKGNQFHEIHPQGYAYEEEVIDSFVENGTLCSYGRHCLKGASSVRFILKLHDIMGRVRFSKKGKLVSIEPIPIDFILNDEPVHRDTIAFKDQRSEYRELSKFLFRCIQSVKELICSNKEQKLYNTNLYPLAYTGMLIQSLALRFFKNNYQYIMYVLTALQRDDDRALCIGALHDQEEAARCFPTFDFNDLL